MAVAAWGPLAGGILSGKYAQPGGPGPRTRIDPDSLNDHQRSVATQIQGAADELGVTALQIAIAWTRARSPLVHPIVGARRVDQLIDNLGAIELDLPHEVKGRLD